MAILNGPTPLVMLKKYVTQKYCGIHIPKTPILMVKDFLLPHKKVYFQSLNVVTLKLIFRDTIENVKRMRTHNNCLDIKTDALTS